MSPRLNPSGGGGRLYGGLPRVTAVLDVLDDKAWQNSWRNKVGHKEANRVMNEAQILGTKVHSLARKIATGEEYEQTLPEEMQPYVNPIWRFMFNHVSRTIATELELISPELGYGGTLDLYCQLHDGSYAVIDWKTTHNTDRKQGVQLAAYALLLRANGYTVNRRAVVHIRKDDKRRGTYKVRWYGDHLADVKCWKGALEVWRWKNQNLLKKLGEATG